MNRAHKPNGYSATIEMDRRQLFYHVVPFSLALNQDTHTTKHNPMHIKVFPTDFPSRTLETSPITSSAKAVAAPVLLLRGTRSMTLQRMSSTPTSSRSVLGLTDGVLRSWAICSGVIGEPSLATPARSTVKDRTRAERRERIAAKDIGDGRWEFRWERVLEGWRGTVWAYHHVPI